MKELSGQLAEKKVTIEITDAARTYLAEKGYDPDFGARPLARIIQEEVKTPLGEELLFGALEKGGTVVVEDRGRARRGRTHRREEAGQEAQVHLHGGRRRS